MKVGWLQDDSAALFGFTGGAEIAAAELIRRKPDGIEIIPCPPEAIARDVDCYVIQNCTAYGYDTVFEIGHKPVIKVVHDVWMQGDLKFRNWLARHASLMIFSSPLHLSETRYKVDCPTTILPPAADYRLFQRAKDTFERKGMCWIGRFDPSKGILETIRKAQKNGWELDYYGQGYHLNEVQKTGRYRGVLRRDEVASTMAQYKTFVMLPRDVEPFGLTIAEAYFAGCDLILNDNCGALWWIENSPHLLDSGAQLFWDRVFEVAS